MQTVKTPCVGICSTGIGDDVCRGCKRFAHEVVSWNGFSHDQKLRIEQRLVQLLTNIISYKIQLVDEALLQWQIQHQQLNVSKHRNLYCQCYELIKAGASQIEDTKEFGFMVLPEFQGLSLKALCEEIDQEFYMLSVAHYERYFAA